jgi:hypothetical protein
MIGYTISAGFTGSFRQPHETGAARHWPHRPVSASHRPGIAVADDPIDGDSGGDDDFDNDVDVTGEDHLGIAWLTSRPQSIDPPVSIDGAAEG